MKKKTGFDDSAFEAFQKLAGEFCFDSMSVVLIPGHEIGIATLVHRESGSSLDVHFRLRRSCERVYKSIDDDDDDDAINHLFIN